MQTNLVNTNSKKTITGICSTNTVVNLDLRQLCYFLIMNMKTSHTQIARDDILKQREWVGTVFSREKLNAQIGIMDMKYHQEIIWPLRNLPFYLILHKWYNPKINGADMKAKYYSSYFVWCILNSFIKCNQPLIKRIKY